ncbi:MAG: hypothetical protein FWE53_01835 [Firmicutes bacterium]|nr:hypothetical protein [Bacillota bacterium]
MSKLDSSANTTRTDVSRIAYAEILDNHVSNGKSYPEAREDILVSTQNPTDSVFGLVEKNRTDFDKGVVDAKSLVLKNLDDQRLEDIMKWAQKLQVSLFWELKNRKPECERSLGL